MSYPQPRTALHIAAMLAAAALMLCIQNAAMAADAAGANSKWTHGLPDDKSWFPIAVWCQDPVKAAQYEAAGINLYVGLWKGPTEQHLADLKAAKMKVICAQNEVALKHLDDPTIVGWMHGDEPDNAQSIPGGKGYGPPILPEKIVEEYKRIQAADPSRPVMLNLGMGVAWDDFKGRGVRMNKPEDYTEYAKGADLVTYDIYPVANAHKEVADKLWLVPFGVERLREWTHHEKLVWNCIECTHIETADKKATPHQVKSEVWMSLIHGSKGLIYFVHEFKPKFNEHALLDDPPMLAAVTALNKQIHDLAPVLNSATLASAATVQATPSDAIIDTMVKQYEGGTYVFAAGMRDSACKAAFQVAAIKKPAKAEVLGENRSIDVTDGKFEDEFKAFDVHLYKIVEQK